MDASFVSRYVLNQKVWHCLNSHLCFFARKVRVFYSRRKNSSVNGDAKSDALVWYCPFPKKESYECLERGNEQNVLFARHYVRKLQVKCYTPRNGSIRSNRKMRSHAQQGWGKCTRIAGVWGKWHHGHSRGWGKCTHWSLWFLWIHKFNMFSLQSFDLFLNVTCRNQTLISVHSCQWKKARATIHFFHNITECFLDSVIALPSKNIKSISSQGRDS